MDIKRRDLGMCGLHSSDSGENQLGILFNMVIIHIAVFWDGMPCKLVVGYKVLRSPFLSLYLCVGFGRSLNFYHDRVTTIIEATGNCTREDCPLFQINNTTSTVYELFIYSEAKYVYYNFLGKNGVIWPFSIIRP
jgi:hypothetical protein